MCEEEQVASERSGHTAAVDEQYLYVWGGYVCVSHHDLFLPNDEIWLYDILTGLWKRHNMYGAIPPSMSGMCGCVVDGHLYIFGGCCDDGQTNEVSLLVNLQDGKYMWKKLRHRSGGLLSQRDKLSCWLYKGRIIYFGGYGHKRLNEINDPKSFVVDEASRSEEIFWGWNNEIHEFDPENISWTEPQTFETRITDVYCMDLNLWTWSEMVPNTAVPSGRSWHTLTAVSDTSLFLFGGLSVDCKPMSDTWLFNVGTKEWIKMEHPNQVKPRLWHTACEGRDSEVVVFGGSHDNILLVDTGHSKEVLVFHTQPYPLIRLCEDFIAKNASVFQSHIHCLPPKLRHAVYKRTTFFRPTRKSHNVFKDL